MKRYCKANLNKLKILLIITKILYIYDGFFVSSKNFIFLQLKTIQNYRFLTNLHTRGLVRP